MIVEFNCDILLSYSSRINILNDNLCWKINTGNSYLNSFASELILADGRKLIVNILTVYNNMLLMFDIILAGK